jgi:hypothetical protein
VPSVGFRAFEKSFIGKKNALGKSEFKFFFDRPAIDRALDRKTKRVLTGVGAQVRNAVRWSMKKAPARARKKYIEVLKRFAQHQATSEELDAARRKTVSRKNEPPFYRIRLLKDRIYFGYEPDTRSVVIGPVRFESSYVKSTQGKTGAELLEEGGMASFNELRGRGRYQTYVHKRPYMEPQRKFATELFKKFMRQENL